MSFFNKVLASIGVGSAKVDTRLETQKLYAGQEVRGVVHIQGGSIDQQIDNVYLQLLTNYIREINDHRTNQTATIASYRIVGDTKVKAGEKLEIPFSFTLPYECPVSLGRQPVWIKTVLDIEMAADPTDNDAIEVLPHPYVQTVLEAISSLGFRLKSSQCEYYPRGGRLPFIQEFEFMPTTQFRGQLQELEAVFYPNEDGVGVLLEMDRRMHGLAGLFSEAFDLDLEESKHKIFIPSDQLKQGSSVVADQLARYIQSRL